jgi:hypothetical protein
MTTRTLKTVTVLTFLILWFGTSASFGFYDPSVQRWVNRDPIYERGGRNPYGFVYNNPIGLIDRFGEVAYGWPVVPPPGYPPTFPQRPPSQKPCGSDNCNPFQISQNALAAEARNHNSALDPDPYGGGYRHCVAACLLTRCYGAIGGAMRLIRDLIDETNDPNNPQYQNSQGDMQGERAGEQLALSSSQDCEHACLERYPPLQGPPAPGRR